MDALIPRSAHTAAGGTYGQNTGPGPLRYTLVRSGLGSYRGAPALLFSNYIADMVEGGFYSNPLIATLKSLLAAIWLQMRRFMLGEDNHCEWCNKPFYKSRRDKRYCNDHCASSARAHKRYIREKQCKQEGRETTRRKLRRWMSFDVQQPCSNLC